MPQQPNEFGAWLNIAMRDRGLSQAELARVVGVADTQISRWRRGQVVPTLRYLQQIADTFGVPRNTLDRLAGYPVPLDTDDSGPAAPGPADLAELQAYQARYRQMLEEKIPRPMWRAYADACEALAEALSNSFEQASGGERRSSALPRPADPGAPPPKDPPHLGFHGRHQEGDTKRG